MFSDRQVSYLAIYELNILIVRNTADSIGIFTTQELLLLAVFATNLIAVGLSLSNQVIGWEQ